MNSKLTFGGGLALIIVINTMLVFLPSLTFSSDYLASVQETYSRTYGELSYRGFADNSPIEGADTMFWKIWILSFYFGVGVWSSLAIIKSQVLHKIVFKKRSSLFPFQTIPLVIKRFDLWSWILLLIIAIFSLDLMPLFVVYPDGYLQIWGFYVIQVLLPFVFCRLTLCDSSY